MAREPSKPSATRPRRAAQRAALVPGGARLRAESEPPRPRAGRPAPPVRLRGRDPELTALERHLAALADGHGGAVLIEGPPGSGKTSVLDEVEARAAGSGVRVFRGAGDPAAGVMPFGPLLDALLNGRDPVLDGGALREIAKLPDPRFWLMQELQERLEHAALAAPLLVVLDDVQWADDATLLALRTLPRRLSTHAILWLLALRPGSAVATAGALEEGGARVLRLAPLGRGAVAEIARDIFGAVPDAGVVDLACDVEGRPFYLIEFLRGLRDEGLVRVEGGTAWLAGRKLPARLRDTVAARLARLSEPAREAVQMASVLGKRFSAEHLALLVGSPAPGLLAPVQEALASGLLVERDDALAFRHDLIREAVDATLPRTMRHALRRRAVALMLERDAPAGEVAALLVEIAEPGDRTAIGVLRRAAAEVTQTSPMTAAQLSRRALELTAPDDPDRPAIVAETVPLLFRAGRGRDARALADGALQGGLEPDLEATLRLGLAQLSMHFSYAEIVTQCRQALALPGVSPGLRLHARVLLTFGFWVNGDWQDLAADADADVAATRAAGDPQAERAALTNRSAAAYAARRYREALDYAEQAVAVTAAPGPERQLLITRDRYASDMWGAWLHTAVGALDQALPWVDEGLRQAQESGRAPDMRLWLCLRARALLSAGRLADARADAEAALEMFDDVIDGPAPMKHAWYTLARVSLHTGDRRGLRAAAASATVLRDDASLNLRRTGEWIAALLADAEGDSVEAMAALEGTLRALGTASPVFAEPHDACELLALLRVVLRAADRAAGELVVAEAERRAALNPDLPLHPVVARHARALLEGDPEALRGCVDKQTLDLLPGPIDQALALEDVAAAVTANDAAEAIGHLDAALELYGRAGAERDVARVRRRLRELGVRRRRATRARPTSGWAGLTEAELAVVRLVAEGATNRQAAERLFLSPHTVSSHLRHAFEKLNIRSRVELAMLYAER